MAKRKITIEMGGFESEDGPKVKATRVYATDDVLFLPNGVRVPKGNSWRLVFEAKAYRKGKLNCHEDFVLDPTANQEQKGPKLYEMVPVGLDGKETWHGPDNQFVIPADLGSRFFFCCLFEAGALMAQRLESGDSVTRFIHGGHDTRSAA